MDFHFTGKIKRVVQVLLQNSQKFKPANSRGAFFVMADVRLDGLRLSLAVGPLKEPEMALCVFRSSSGYQELYNSLINYYICWLGQGHCGAHAYICCPHIMWAKSCKKLIHYTVIFGDRLPTFARALCGQDVPIAHIDSNVGGNIFGRCWAVVLEFWAVWPEQNKSLEISASILRHAVI